MMNVAPMQCPNCGAAMHIDPHVRVATCAYCRNSVAVDQPRAYKAPPLAPPGVGFQYAPVKPAQRSSAAGCVVAAAIFCVVAVAGAGALFFVRSAAPNASRSNRSEEPRRGEPGPPAVAPKPSDIVGDLTKVELVGLIEQAHTVALKRRPGAKFVSAVAFNTVGGHANLAPNSGNHVVVTFEFIEFDKTQPAGKDKREGSVMVVARDGNFSVMDTPSAIHLKMEPDHYPLDVPRCRSADLWHNVTASGVPNDAVATIHLYDNKTFTPGSGTVWSIRVDGHDEYRREVDAGNCKVVKDWSKSR